MAALLVVACAGAVFGFAVGLAAGYWAAGHDDDR